MAERSAAQKQSAKRLQAALYYARKRRVARKVAQEAEAAQE